MEPFAEIADSSVVHQNMQLAEGTQGLRDHILHVGLIRDGSDHRQCPPSVHTDPLHHPVELFLPATGYHDGGAFIRE